MNIEQEINTINELGIDGCHVPESLYLKVIMYVSELWYNNEMTLGQANFLCQILVHPDYSQLCYNPKVPRQMLRDAWKIRGAEI